MERERIDRAIHAQLDRLTSLLRDVDRSGGRDTWGHLWSHGHAYATIRSAINQEKLREIKTYHYALTDAGRQYLADIEQHKLRQQA